jgi:hypothetical protein
VIIYTDANETDIAYHREDGLSFSVKEASPGNCTLGEFKAIKAAIVANSSYFKRMEIRSDCEVAVKQLNHEFGIKDNDNRQEAIAIWNYIASNNLTVEFVWVSRNNNPAGKMLG